MFDLPLSVRKKGTPYYIIWSYAFNPKKILKFTTKEELLKFDIKKFCENFEESLPTPARAETELINRFSLYLTGHLLLGITRVFDYRVTAIFESAERIIARINQPWEFLSVDEASQSLSPIQQEQRPLSPVDNDFDFMEAPRNNDFLDDEFADRRQFEDLQDEEPRRNEEDDQQDEHEQPGAAAQPGNGNGQPPGGQRTRQRAPKRPRPDTDDEDDEDYGKKRKPRRKPVARRGAVDNLGAQLNIARHEDITLREDVLQESLEQDLLNDDLAPIDEEQLAIFEDQHIQLPNDTLLIIKANAQNDDVRESDAVVEHDFDYQEFDVLPARSLSPSRLFAVKTFDSPLIAARQNSRSASPFHGVINASRSTTPQPLFHGVINASRSATPQPPFHGVINVSRSTTPRPQLVSRSTTPRPPQDVEHDFDYQEFDIPPAGSVSPSRIIAVRLFDTPPAPPSTRSSPPFQGYINFEVSRSATPRPQNDGDDFDFSELNHDETAQKSIKKPRQKRRQYAREPVISFDIEEIRNRDTIYLQKDLRNAKYSKFRSRLDNFHSVYKYFLGQNVDIEANDELRDVLDERIGRLDVERARHRATRSQDLSAFRAESRLTELHSGRETPKEDPLEEEQQQPRGDHMDYDFDNDFRPLSPPPGEDREISMHQNQEQIRPTPPRIRSRSPIQQFQDIEYVEPVPLPPGMEHLLSPPRALPRELFNTSSRAPFKELSCNYDHDDLYFLILYRCAKEKKAVFKFSEFANHWPRPYIAKQYHNFLLLSQMGKILARNVDGVFYSFIIIPNDEFKMNIAKVLVHLNRNAAGVSV
uniref:Rad21/Rec8-like protein N-terminal domain-containing protein n=1 Tax=Panagrolaimus superbus TaxID=310955 RepID=A0A914XXY1_9BILA